MRVVKRSDMVHRQLCSKETGESYALSMVLSEALASKDFFLRHEVLAPGKRASAPHFHEKTDELILMLSGQAMLYEGAQKALLKAGDCANFAAGGSQRHYLANESNESAEYFAVSRKTLISDIVF